MTNFATGCIYEYDEEHAEGSGKGFTEEDPPNFDGSFYSMSKAMVERLLACYRYMVQIYANVLCV